MTEVIVFAILGLGAGALISALGTGLVLTYRGSGVINFAAGAIAMYVGYAYWDLRVNGQVAVPPLPNPLVLIEAVGHWFGLTISMPHWPTKIDLGGATSTPIALVGALALAALLGLGLHLLFRPLRAAPALAKVVASVGVLLTLQAVVVRRYTSVPKSVPAIFPTSAAKILGARVPVDRLWLGAVSVVLAVGLSLFFRYSRAGWAVRAASENDKAATLVGINAGRLAAGTWVVTCMLAGAIGILAAPIIQLNPTLLPLLVVPALGAALLGRFTSFLLTAAAALAVGSVQSLVTLFQTKTWWPQAGHQPVSGLGDVVVFGLIVAALMLRGSSLPSRGQLDTVRLPPAPQPRHMPATLTVVLVVGATALLLSPFGLRQAMINSFVAAVLCLSLVVVTGLVGQVSLGQMAIAGIAGFALSNLASRHGIGFPWSPLLAALAATVVGLMAAIPALRVRGVNLAVVTLGAAVAVESFVFGNPTFNGGVQGAKVPPPSVFGARFGPNSRFILGDGKVPTAGFGLAVLAVLVAVAAGVAAIRAGRLGRAMLAVRANERAAAAIGISVARTKLLAFAAGSFIAGLGGALTGYSVGLVTAGSFGVFISLELVAIAYMGGITSVGGALVGGLLVAGGVSFYILEHYLHVSNQFELLLGGLGLIITTLLNPMGIAGMGGMTWRRLATRTASRGKPDADGGHDGQRRSTVNAAMTAIGTAAEQPS